VKSPDFYAFYEFDAPSGDPARLMVLYKP